MLEQQRYSAPASACPPILPTVFQAIALSPGHQADMGSFDLLASLREQKIRNLKFTSYKDPTIPTQNGRVSFDLDSWTKDITAL